MWALATQTETGAGDARATLQTCARPQTIALCRADYNQPQLEWLQGDHMRASYRAGSRCGGWGSLQDPRKTPMTLSSQVDSRDWGPTPVAQSGHILTKRETGPRPQRGLRSRDAGPAGRERRPGSSQALGVPCLAAPTKHKGFTGLASVSRSGDNCHTPSEGAC